MILVDDLVDRGPHSADQHEAHRREDADRGRPPPVGAAEERGPSPSPRSPRRRRRTPPFPPSASSPRRDSHPDKGERKKDDLGSADQELDMDSLLRGGRVYVMQYELQGDTRVVKRLSNLIS